MRVLVFVLHGILAVRLGLHKGFWVGAIPEIAMHKRLLARTIVGHYFLILSVVVGGSLHLRSVGFPLSKRGKKGRKRTSVDLGGGGVR